MEMVLGLTSKGFYGEFPLVQWLKLSSVRSSGSGRGTKISNMLLDVAKKFFLNLKTLLWEWKELIKKKKEKS